MVNTCVAPGCEEGYKEKKKKPGTDNEHLETSHGKEKVSLFKFPNEPLKAKWIARVPRLKWTPSNNARLCEKHFLPSDFKEERDDKTRGRAKKRGSLVRKKLKADAIPSIWPNLPSHLSKETPPQRITKMSTSTSRELMETLREKQAKEKDSFSSLAELEKKFCLKEIPVDACINKGHYILFFSLNGEEKPEIKYNIKLLDNLTYDLWCDGLSIKRNKVDGIPNLPTKLTSFSLLITIVTALEKMYEGKIRENVADEELIEEIVKCLKNSRLYDNKKVAFLTEQLILSCISPHKRRYSSSLLAMSVMWLKISPAAYRHVYQEGILTLPTERRLQQLSSALDVDMRLGESTKAYLKARMSKLAPKDLSVSLLIDEIYCAKQVQYAHGRFYGNENAEITKTLLCLMIKSVAGKYRDVIAMMPISNLNADKQYTIWCNTATALKEIGFDTVLTMTDGNKVNITFFNKICEGSIKPWVNSPFTGGQMYVGFDPTHLFKCFYTNFYNKKFFKCPSLMEGGTLHASFDHLKELYDIELGKSVKMAYKLSDKMLHPSSIEKTNVALADSCFHESTINALRYYSNHGYSKFFDTAEVLQIFRTWFNATNVKSLYAGQRTRDANRNPVTKSDRSVLEIFHKFGEWLELWKSSGESGLSNQTFQAAIQTTKVLPDLSTHLLEVKGLDYVLLGHISSDYIEGRFSWYRQSSGANYNISVLQILQSEKAIRIQSLIDTGFQMSDLKDIFISTSEGCDNLTEEGNSLTELIPNFQFSESLDIPFEDEAIIYYVAGAIARSVIKKMSHNKGCEQCRSLLTSGRMDENEIKFQETLSDENMNAKEEFISIVSRGGLLKPSDLVYITCVHAWTLYHHIKESKEAFDLLLKATNPRNLFTNVFVHILNDNSSMTEITAAKCGNSHIYSTFAKNIASTFFNLMAKNYISDINDRIHAGKKRNSSITAHSSDARKIKKLTSN